MIKRQRSPRSLMNRVGRSAKWLWRFRDSIRRNWTACWMRKTRPGSRRREETDRRAEVHLLTSVATKSSGYLDMGIYNIGHGFGSETETPAIRTASLYRACSHFLDFDFGRPSKRLVE